MPQIKMKYYGVNGKSIEEVKEFLERKLSVEFSLRDSGYYAGEYFKFKSDDESILIYKNFDSGRSTHVRSKYKKYEVIIEAYTSKNIKLKEAVSGYADQLD